MALDLLLLAQCYRSTVRNAVGTLRPGGLGSTARWQDVVAGSEGAMEGKRAVLTGAETKMQAEVRQGGRGGGKQGAEGAQLTPMRTGRLRARWCGWA